MIQTQEVNSILGKILNPDLLKIRVEFGNDRHHIAEDNKAGEHFYKIPAPPIYAEYLHTQDTPVSRSRAARTRRLSPLVTAPRGPSACGGVAFNAGPPWQSRLPSSTTPRRRP